MNLEKVAMQYSLILKNISVVSEDAITFIFSLLCDSGSRF